MIDISERQIIDSLLELVRLGIGHQTFSPIKDVDWTHLFRLSQRQGITAIVLDGVQAMFENDPDSTCQNIEPELKLRWITTVYNNYERAYLRYKASIGRLADFYNAHGFKLMIIKGYGLSLNYPRPDHRPCGDIDTWAFGDYKSVDEALHREFEIRIDSSHHHHTVYEWEGIGVENHYDFVNVHYGHRNDELELIFKELAKDDTYFTEIDGCKVYLPQPNLNALFLLRHTMLHFASTSMTIRQLLDWGFFVKKYFKDVDWDWLQVILRYFDMTNFFDLVNAICVEDLGFDATEYPYINVDENLKKRVLSDMIFPEFNEREPKEFIPRYLYKLRRRRANLWKRKICYNDVGLGTFFRSVLSHFIRPRG
ncbi:MAG: hypothetical protein E7117_02630 [Bacteroidales bacterium]|nr:hypothetical protein [Bacteroidales bacterium]